MLADMESHSDEEGGRRPNPEDARETLGRLEADGAELARRASTPGWYYPAVGVLVAPAVGALSQPGPVSIFFTSLAIFGSGLLAGILRRRTGVAVSRPTGPRSRREFVRLVVLVATAFAAALAISFLPISAWWAVLPAALALAAVLLLGPRYDAAIGVEIAGGAA